MGYQEFTNGILKWYKIHKRDLPWRHTDNPYFIWLSEIILQQTRVNQGLPYYNNFTKTFPDIHSLARAPELKVLSLWQGLGYYSRARNLHASAKKLVETNEGKLPRTYHELLSVKGIGPYTAAAIASFAYKERVPVVDGNVFRVLSRVFGIETDIATTAGIKEFQAMAHKLIPEKNSDTYNQAIMEFGALQCVPASPTCEDCPINQICFANKHGLQASLPVKTKLVKKKTRHFNYLCFRHKNQLILKERVGKDIWKGLYEFPMIESTEFLTPKELKKHVNLGKIIINKSSKPYKHILTHQTIFAQFWLIDVEDSTYFKKLLSDQNAQNFNKKQIINLPKPVLINKFLEEYIFV